MKPFLKWAGGKTRLLPELLKYVPEKYERYIDPFVGGGALAFTLQPQKAILGDVNQLLVQTYYGIISDMTQVRIRLLIAARRHKEDPVEFYKEMRRKLNKDDHIVSHLSAIFIYINKTCYNGLFRVNKRGKFNVPLDKNHVNVDEIADYEYIDNLKAIGCYLKNKEICLRDYDFRETLTQASSGDFVYCDPPYHVKQKFGKNGNLLKSPTMYTAQGFTEKDQADLALICADLAKKGCHLLASNSDTDFIRQTWGQYGCFDIHEVEAPRSISCKGNGRVKVKELIITNVRREG
ncbi:modification methylase [Candidatus Magnetobacterium bavaricum]|uniref:Site-specific DNA-methyltransferase (adenine-specific) n=1 Tax=Candidatus Magnetobacterium bavaricum TaxID=29290 RepID=A0A0F3GQY9_9BACT|nr:modification methylase [Candidatus Magnetobacterium bavaricum]